MLLVSRGNYLAILLKAFNQWRSAVMPILAIALVITYVFVVEHYYGWMALIKAWEGVSPLKLFMIFALLFFTYAVRGLRVYNYCYPDTHKKMWSCIRLTLLHNFLNNVLPMRTGEASFPLLMRREFGMPLAKATAVLFIFRFFDFQVLLLVGAIALYMLKPEYHWVVFFLPPLIFLPFIFFLKKSFLQKFSPTHKRKILNIVHNLLSALPDSFLELARAWCLTFLCWVVKICAFAMILLWFAPATFWQATILAFAGELSAILPVQSPAGLGTYEAGMLGVSHMLGVRGDWVLFASIQLHMLIIVSSFISAVVAYIVPQAKEPVIIELNQS